MSDIIKTLVISLIVLVDALIVGGIAYLIFWVANRIHRKNKLARVAYETELTKMRDDKIKAEQEHTQTLTALKTQLEIMAKKESVGF